MSFRPSLSRDAAPVTTEHEHFPSDRARLELLRGGRAHVMPPHTAEPRVSVVVLSPDARRFEPFALATAMGQSVRVAQVLVVVAGADGSFERRIEEATGHDGRVRVLQVTHPGLAPAAPRARRFVRQAQLLRAALPFVTGDWVAAMADDVPMTTDFLARALARAHAQTLEMAWPDDDAPLSGRGFAGVVWAAALAALAPHDHAGWDGEPSDATWWARLAEAGVRGPGAQTLHRRAR